MNFIIKDQIVIKNLFDKNLLIVLYQIFQKY